MALSTYSELQASVAGWLNRSDLTVVIVDFVALAEATIKRRLRRRTARASIPIASASVTLPADCAELRSISFVSTSYGQDLPIRIGTPEQLAEVRARHSATGRPVQAAVIGAQLVFAPAPDAVYTADITYFQQLTPLTASAPSNVVLTEAPDAYLFGALLQAAPYLAHDERIPVWQSRFDAAIDELNAVREHEELNASVRPVRLSRPF